ncbi:MAG: restriction endonuclease subunit S [Gammaproteobacteria bacterium]|nr:restriction endonuclease subunit S [Gammaproteobacteria bacterium]
MKKGWQKKKLSDLFQVGSSKRVLKSQWKTSGVPFYRGREVTRLAADGFVENELFISEEHFAELSKEYGVPKAGDIVITAIGTIGNSHVVRSSDRFYFKDASVLWMKRTAEVSSEFVNLWLKSPRFFDQLDRGNGATVDTLTIQKLQSVEISAPPLAEQQRIVGVLDEAFAGLATAQAHAAQNLQNARALFASHLQSVFTHRGKGWVETTVDKLSTNLDSKRVPITKSDRKAGDYPYYGASGIVDYVADYIFDGDALLVSEDGANLLMRSTPIAFSVSGKYWVNNHAHILKFENMATQRFVEFYLESIKLDDFVTGAAQPKLNQKALNSIPIPIPPKLAEQESIVTQLDALGAETQRLTRLYEQRQAALAALKKSLLHQAFTGEL